MKKLITLMLTLSVVACNSGGSVGSSDNSESSGYALLSKGLPTYGNCKNEKLCVTQINPATKDYDNNTLSNIRVGNFGLVGYTLKNQSKSNSPAPSFTKDAFPNSDFKIDEWRSSCLGNELSPQEECNLVLRYLPSGYGNTGEIEFNIVSGKLETRDINESYSSRVK